jgi:drug/metabolite transporter (DMT)-like permease
MSWLIFAFAGPVLWAVSTHIDKYLVERYFKEGNVAVLMVFTAIIGAMALPFIWFFQPQVVSLDYQSAAVVIVSGALYMAAIYFYLQALQTEEASTVAPFFQAAGIFGAVLGYFVLREVLTLAQIAGVFLTIGGSVLLSLRLGQKTGRVKTRLVVLMLACALAIALSSLIFKFFAVRDEFWTTTFWNFAGQAIFGVALMVIPANVRQFVKMMRTNTGAVLSINGANELINLGGGLGMRYALLFAPLGIVQAISSTTSFFVLGFGVLLSLFFPRLGREELASKKLLQKFIAIALVVAGVLLING